VSTTSTPAAPERAVIDSRIRTMGYVGIPAYIGAAGTVALALRRWVPLAASALVLSAAGPLMWAGWYLARLVSKQLHGSVKRFWSHMAGGNLALGSAFVAWSLTLLTDYRPFGAAAVSLALLSAFSYFSAVASRIRPMEGTGIAPLNIANLSAVVAVIGCYYFYGPFGTLVQKRGLSPSLFVGLVLVSTSGVGYLLQVMFRRYRQYARPPDQVLAVGVGAAMVFAVGDAVFLLTDKPMESIAMAFAALVVVSPLALAPLAETGRSLQPREQSVVLRSMWIPIPLSAVALTPLVLHVISASARIEAWRVGVVFAAVSVISIASISSQRIIVRRAEAQAAQQVAIETLYEKEAAKEAALLDILQRVSEGWGLTDIVEGSLSAVVQTTSASRAIFLVVDMARNSVQILGAKGLSDSEVAEMRATLVDPYMLQRALRAGRTVATAGTPLPGLSETSARFGAVAFASTAISGWEESGTAVLCADAKTPDARFGEDDTRMMEAIADYVSLALSRMRLFRELAASEERYRVLVEESTDGVVELDRDGRVLFSNRVLAQMLGKEPVQLLGESLPELLGVPRWSPPDPGEVTRTTTAVKVNDEEIILEIYQSRRRDDKVQAVVRNVTERHNSALRLRQLYEQLAEKERLRTQALSKLIKAEEETRSRIAADLHDGPVQEFSRLAIALDLARTHLERGDLRQGFETLANVRKSLSAEVLRLRLLMTELRPPVLEERGLHDAIETYCRTFENETGIRVTISSPERFSIEKSAELVLYRIFQEAMTNVKKHSYARHVEISLHKSPDGVVTLDISDDGVGFDPSIIESVVQGGHIGIVSMAERAELAGGSCQVHGQPGQGTTVRVTISGEVERHAG
jgi:PAS domain S-box-containing protein